MNSLTGTTIDDKFTILGVIGTGGFGSVYRARQIQFDREVALKVLDTSNVQNEVLKRFEREAKILQSFQTKFIPAIYGYGVWENRPYMAIELVDGISLEAILRRDGAMSFDVLRPIIDAVAQALAYAHSHGVAHRDLSPANILIINKHGMPAARIIDFGLAAFTQPDLRNHQDLTQGGQALGTLYYMSPEQCLTNPADARSDLYALGCIIHRALAGAPPFDDDNPVLMLSKHVHEPLPRLTADVPPQVQFILDKATAKSPDERYQTADEFLQDWRNLDGVQGTASRRGSGFASSLGVLAIIFLMLATTLTVWLFAPHPPSPENPAQLLPAALKAYDEMWEHIPENSHQKYMPALKAQFQHILQLDDRTHKLLPRQREVVLGHLAFILQNMQDPADRLRAYEMAKDELELQVANNMSWIDPNTYEGAAEGAGRKQRQEASAYFQQLLHHSPPFPNITKMHLRLFITRLYLLDGELDKAEAALPAESELSPQNVGAWVLMRDALRKARGH